MKVTKFKHILLAVDIGNTNIKLALFKGRRIRQIWRLATAKNWTVKQYTLKLKKLFRSAQVKSGEIETILICSVVPRLTAVLQKALSALCGKKPLILGQDVLVPIKNLYKKPHQVGQDRLANAAAAVSKYGSPVIVVDFGTAVTFDLISKPAGYLGGIIVPGMEIALQALINNADLLPKISLNRPKALLGRDTASSMKSGIVYGYALMVEGILRQLKKELKQHPQVIATGGLAGLMRGYCKSINKIDENLTLEGLRIVEQQGKQRKK